MNADTTRIINTIEAIETLNRDAVCFDYEDSIASDKTTLKEQFSRFQNESNTLTNALKAEGIEIEWDGISIFVKKDDTAYLKRDMFNSGEWEPWTCQFVK